MSKPGLRDDACRDGQGKDAHENGKHEHRKVAGTEGVRDVEIHQLWVEGAWFVAGLFAQFRSSLMVRPSRSVSLNNRAYSSVSGLPLGSVRSVMLSVPFSLIAKR